MIGSILFKSNKFFKIKLIRKSKIKFNFSILNSVKNIVKIIKTFNKMNLLNNYKANFKFNVKFKLNNF